MIEIQQRQRRQFCRGAARSVHRHLLAEVGVGVLVLHLHSARARTVVGLVVVRGDNPVPTEIDETDFE